MKALQNKSVVISISFVACLFAATLSPAFGQSISFPVDTENASNVEAYVQLDLMARISLFKNDDGLSQMQRLSVDIDPFYKQYLYDEHKKKPWTTATINLFTGGVGSLVEGSLFTGIVSQAGMLASYGVILYAVSPLVPQTQEVRQPFVLAAQIGGVVFGVFSIVMPFIDAKIYNTRLKAALSIDER